MLLKQCAAQYSHIIPEATSQLNEINLYFHIIQKQMMLWLINDDVCIVFFISSSPADPRQSAYYRNPTEDRLQVWVWDERRNVSEGKDERLHQVYCMCHTSEPGWNESRGILLHRVVDLTTAHWCKMVCVCVCVCVCVFVCVCSG